MDEKKTLCRPLFLRSVFMFGIQSTLKIAIRSIRFDLIYFIKRRQFQKDLDYFYKTKNGFLQHKRF